MQEESLQSSSCSFTTIGGGAFTEKPQQQEQLLKEDNDIMENNNEEEEKMTVDDSSSTTREEQSNPAPLLIQRFRHLSLSPARVSTPTTATGDRASPSATPVRDVISRYSAMTTPSRMTLCDSPSDDHEPRPRNNNRNFYSYDLTPVTRNTSSCDGKGDRDEDPYVLVSPDDDDHVLHGELLALPSDLSASAKGDREGFPPLKVPRAMSMSMMPRPRETAAAVREPMPFPPRQSYSFTSREQYEKWSHIPTETTAADPTGLTPYQPCRDDLRGDVGALPEEDLRQIFISRQNNKRDCGNDSSERSLMSPIPLDERQWSIPSIRMANHLQGSTTTTSYTDEEDELYFRDDEASLSSRGSNLCFPAEDMIRPPRGEGNEDHGPQAFRLENPLPSFPPPRHPVAVICTTTTSPQDIMETETDEDVDRSGERPPIRRRRKKRSQKEMKAFEWLRTVEAGDDVVAEAASSKFLTGSMNAALQPSSKLFATGSFQRAERRRQTSSPPVIRRQTSSPPTLAMESATAMDAAGIMPLKASS